MYGNDKQKMLIKSFYIKKDFFNKNLAIRVYEFSNTVFK